MAKNQFILVITFAKPFVLLNYGIINIMQSYFGGEGRGEDSVYHHYLDENTNLEKLIEAADWRLFPHIQVGHTLMQGDTGLTSNRSL